MKQITMDFETYTKELNHQFYMGIDKGLEQVLDYFNSKYCDDDFFHNKEDPYFWHELKKIKKKLNEIKEEK